MHSNGWHWDGPSKLYRTSQQRSARDHLYAGAQSFLFCQNRKSEDGAFVLKMDLLGKKLRKRAGKEHHLEYSRYSNLKSTKCPELIKIQNQKECEGSDINTIKNELESSNIREIGDLDDNVLFLTDKTKELMEISKNHSEEIQHQLQYFQKVIKQIGQRASLYFPVKKEFRMYSDILDQFKKERQIPIIRKPASRTITRSSIKQPSLLLSFKKNTEEQDGYVTLKYSEQSANREGNQTLMEDWQSFQRDNKSRVKKKTQMKSSMKDFEFFPEQIEDRYFQFIREEIVTHLNIQKKQIKSGIDESQEILTKLEDVLEQTVEKIAQEKVQRQDTWKELSLHTSDLVQQISQNLIVMKSEQLKLQDFWDDKLRQLRMVCINKVDEERQVRKQQQKMMIKMIMEVVQFMH